MCEKLLVLILIYYISLVVCDNNNSTYKGEQFPNKYLNVEKSEYSFDDVKFYLDSIVKVLDYFAKEPNNTNINNGVGFYFSKAILKRTLRDYKVIPQEQYKLIKEIIFRADYLLSHYLHKTRKYGWNHLEYRISVLFREDINLIHSIGEFKRNKMKKWILSELQINNYTEEMDRGTLQKIKFVDLIESVLTHNIKLPDSDECLSRIVTNPEPVFVHEMKPCRSDPYCFEAIKSQPSVAYGLSHSSTPNSLEVTNEREPSLFYAGFCSGAVPILLRSFTNNSDLQADIANFFRRLVNNLMYYYIRRCYLYSEQEDVIHMEMLCSFMYRETVYLARKGYFARDLFMEHIALCAIFGYEEFFRKHWLRKAASWVDNNGCLIENRNLEINRTEILKLRTTDAKKIARLEKSRREKLKKNCHEHPMAIALMVFAHAVRYGVHNLKINRQQKMCFL